MSLVYEALQKAEREKHRQTATAPPPAAVASPAPTPATPTTAVAVPPPATHAPGRRGQHYRAILIVCGAVVGLAVAMYFFVTGMRQFAEQKTAPPPSSPLAGDSTTAPTPLPVSPPLAAPSATANDPRFQLTGIMKMGDDYAAVINGRIVQVEHYVDGAIVTSISRDRVTLTVDGREVVVRLY